MSASIENHAEHTPMVANRDSVESMHKMPAGPMTSNMLSHTLGADDPDNPMNWPSYRRIYASAVAWAMGFTV